MTHSCERNWSLLCISKNLHRGRKKQSRCRTRGQKKIPVQKNRKPPMHQERTKTPNCTKVTNTTINDDTCKYDGYVDTMIRMWWARKKTQHVKQTDMRLAKRLGLIQRLRFSNLGLNYRDEHCAGQAVT